MMTGEGSILDPGHGLEQFSDGPSTPALTSPTATIAQSSCHSSSRLSSMIFPASIACNKAACQYLPVNDNDCGKLKKKSRQVSEVKVGRYCSDPANATRNERQDRASQC